jgi:hypothetical protein
MAVRNRKVPRVYSSRSGEDDARELENVDAGTWECLLLWPLGDGELIPAFS